MDILSIIISTIKSSIIEATIPKYKKGVRVIVNFNTTKDPEYWVGTVTGIRKGLVYITFDDGDKGSYKPTRSLVGLVGITKKKTSRKSKIPSKDIDKWLSIDIGKAEPKRKPKSNKVNNKKKEGTKELCFDWFEKYLFGENFGHDEKNTKVENRLWNILKSFIQGTFMKESTPKEVIDGFRKLQECQEYYKDLLTPPTGDIYRGFRFSNRKLKKLKDEPKKLIKHESTPKEGMYVFDYIYTPRDILQSWSISERVASKFANSKIGRINSFKENLENTDSITNSIPAIFIAKIDNTFFLDPKFLQKIENDPDQGEVVRLGKRIKGKLLISKKLFNIIKDR